MIFYVKLKYQKYNCTAFEYTGAHFWSPYFVASKSQGKQGMNVC
jgi:hypothetical protein